MSTPQTAGFGRRVAALVIDWAACIVIARLVLPGAAYGSTESALATLGIFYAEVVLFTWLIGSSFGQRIVGICIIRVDGRPLGLPRILLRTLLICLVIPALVYDSDGRGLHDKAVGSVPLLRRTVPGM